MAVTCPVHPEETETSDAAATELLIAGMNCNGCVQHVTEALRSVPGVASANISLEKGLAQIRWQPGVSQKISTLVAAVEAAGYKAKPLEAAGKKMEEKKWSPLAGWRFNVVIGLICTLPLIIGEWIFGLGMEKWFQW